MVQQLVPLPVQVPLRVQLRVQLRVPLRVLLQQRVLLQLPLRVPQLLPQLLPLPLPLWVLGSCLRYQILSHVFARCASQKTQGHARLARETRAILACRTLSVCFLTR